ncbi:hypothetical protein ABID12_003430 [Martelella mangrovi]|uniref:Uncharacterized protein n=1 Tax=Martelella mangrovi TaxID=1397477 RepID=A0ABV2IH18_9HYPH
MEGETTQEECLWDYIGYQPVRIRQRLAINCPPPEDLKGISRRMLKELHGSKIGKRVNGFDSPRASAQTANAQAKSLRGAALPTFLHFCRRNLLSKGPEIPANHEARNGLFGMKQDGKRGIPAGLQVDALFGVAWATMLCWFNSSPGHPGGGKKDVLQNLVPHAPSCRGKDDDGRKRN